MATDLWTVAKTGDHLATDSSVASEVVRESMIDAAADLSLVEVKALFGQKCTVSSQEMGWVLVTEGDVAAAVLAAAFSDWHGAPGMESGQLH